jgi:isoleucyl-tRNA synthetase
MPFYADYLWRATKAEADAESVHLAKWPEPERIDPALIVAMKQAREVVTSALEARTKAGIKVRQPISKVAGPLLVEELQAVVLDEINAKIYVVEESAVGIDTELTPELLAEGAVRELMRAIQEQRKNNSLLPTDNITLTIETDTLGQFAIESHRDLLVKTVGASTLVFADGGKILVSIGDYRFGFAIEKL